MPTDQNEQTEVATAAPPPAVEPARPAGKPEARGKTRLLPPYAVVLYNDDRHSFPYVIEALRRTFGYGRMKAFRLTLRAHVAGKSHVWSGSKEVAEFKRERLRNHGPDLYATMPVDFPLRCDIEPLPQ